MELIIPSQFNLPEIPDIRPDNSIAAILNDQNMNLISCSRKNVPAGVYDLSVYIANHFRLVYPFLGCMRKQLCYPDKSAESSFVYTANTATEYDAAVSLAKKLRPCGFFMNFSFNNKTMSLSGRLTNLSAYTEFISGTFAELAAAALISKSISNLHLTDAELMRNLIITDKNGTQHELDLAVRHGERLLFIEVKSGTKFCPEQLLTATAPFSGACNVVMFSLNTTPEEAEIAHYFSGVPVFVTPSALNLFVNSWLKGEASDVSIAA